MSETMEFKLPHPAHATDGIKVLAALASNPVEGLTSTSAATRLKLYGPNVLSGLSGVQPVEILIRQVANPMILILVLAMTASFSIRAWIEGSVVGAVILLNVVIGFFQEYRAESILDSLKSLSFPQALVVRDGKSTVVPTTDLVIGDVVEMKTGDTVVADVRLIETHNLETDEAILTGESLPVRKTADATFDPDTPVGDRLNVAYSSTTITKGRARGVVYATGMDTEIGRIAASLQGRGSRRAKYITESIKGHPFKYAKAWISIAMDSVKTFFGLNTGTPLQQKMAWLAIILFASAVLCTLIVLAANKFNTNQEVVIYAVATGLSMIPASLLVVLTITLAAGTNAMAKRHVIVRNGRSLEALGGVTDICSDKTGTLTLGKMVARKAWVPSVGTLSISSSDPINPTSGIVNLSPTGPSSSDELREQIASPTTITAEHPQLQSFLNIASLANLAEVYQEDETWAARGDPTEIAIQVFSSRFNFNKNEVLRREGWRHVAEYPFDSAVKKMSVIYCNNQGRSYIFTKGAVERVLSSCTTILLNSSCDPVSLSDEIKEQVMANMEALASLGLRVLALASKPFTEEIVPSQEKRDEVEAQLQFMGLIGLYDPPRAESKPSVQKCHEAGIKVRMVTGDHPSTARAIAAEVGILPSNQAVTGGMVMTATQFDALSDEEVDELEDLPLVVARCSPQTKVKMVEALKRRGRFCAMTGDGVNDSPSLHLAPIGIAMGASGSDVAKSASDIILTDDNFASILSAVEEGRRMFDNIQKVLCHVLSQNLAQMIALLVGLVFKDKGGMSVFPISPVEIMWIIIVTGGTPDMGLGFEKAAEGILKRPPVKGGIFTWEVMIDTLVYGCWVGGLCLAAFTTVVYGFNKPEEGVSRLGSNCNNEYSPQCEAVFRGRATCFVCLMWFLLFLAWELVDLRRSFFYLHPRSMSEEGEKERKRVVATRWVVDIWGNKFLFWAVIGGFLSVFPVLYIPVVNTKVFKHKGITWEWGVAAVAFVAFFAGIEAWKAVKRVYYRHKEKASISKV